MVSSKSGSCGAARVFYSVILGITALVKLISVLGDAAILGRSNPLLGFLTNRQMLFLATGLELGVAAWTVLWAADFA